MTFVQIVSRFGVGLGAGALVLSMAACGGDSDGTTEAGAPAPAATVVTGEPSAAPAEPADYTADTKKVCASAEKMLEGKELEAFSTKLGELIVYKQAKNSDAAKKAESEAQAKLKAMGTALKKKTDAAKDPELQAAGEKSAAEIAKTAEDDAFFAKIKSVDNLEKVLQPEMIAWFTPVAVHCKWE